VDDVPHQDRSLTFWHYNTSKLGVTLDLDSVRGRELLVRLLEDADLFLESEKPGRLAALGLDYEALRLRNPGLVMVSITPFGPDGPRADEEVTDLTILAGAGPVWSCGYDDHTIPPVRGGGNQGYQTACHFAVMGALVAVLSRDVTGLGQHVEVNMHAASNVTTEAASYTWLVSQNTVQRQTGRHAAVNPTLPTQRMCADGRWANTGTAVRRGPGYAKMHEWLETLGLLDDFAEAPFLELGAQRDTLDMSLIPTDPEVAAIFEAGRKALDLCTEALPAYEFFRQGQERDIQVGIIYSPDEVYEDPHFVARGFPVEVEHPELGRTFGYPGAPYQFRSSPWRIRRRAPLLGEDNDRVYGALGLPGSEIAQLRADGVI
jgi:crotonobetainyl-CoA:carnitine CoA-transferase CaiB-like acyl-CoA transferase